MPLWTPFLPLWRTTFSDFYARFIQKLSEHNVKSLIEGYVGADCTNFSSLMTIPLNFDHEHWELF